MLLLLLFGSQRGLGVLTQAGPSNHQALKSKSTAWGAARPKHLRQGQNQTAP